MTPPYEKQQFDDLLTKADNLNSGLQGGRMEFGGLSVRRAVFPVVDVKT